MKITGFVNRVDELPPQGDHESGLTVVSLEGLPLLVSDSGILNGLRVGTEIQAQVNVNWKKADNGGKARPQFWLLGIVQ